jgi:hypothetical protein
MAVIRKEKFINNISAGSESVVYVDSVNVSSYKNELYNIAISYIRCNDKDYDSFDFTSNKKELFVAKNSDDIYYNKKDGHYIVYESDGDSIVMYKKITLKGRIYNSIVIEKVFKLTFDQCKKIVPLAIQKETEKNIYKDFSDELIQKVSQYKNRNK